MAITLVQSKGASGNSGSTATVSALTATTAGNLLVMLVSASKNPGDVTFTPPANWVQAGVTVHNDVFIAVSTALYYYPNCPAGITSISTTISSTVSAWHIYVMEFSGVATASPLDGTAAREQDHTTTPSSGAITTTAAGDLLVGWSEMDDNNGVYTLTQPAGWTALTKLDDTSVWTTTFPAYQVAGAAGSYNYQPSKSASVPDGTFTIAAFKAASGGGSTVNGIGESDGVGTASARATLSTAAQSTGSGQASASARLATAAQSTGRGQATASASIATAAQSVGVGQASAAATLAAVALSAGSGTAQASATLSTAATSDGHALDVAAAPSISPAGAVSSGVGTTQARIITAALPAPVALRLVASTIVTAASLTTGASPAASTITAGTGVIAASITAGASPVASGITSGSGPTAASLTVG